MQNLTSILKRIVGRFNAKDQQTAPEKVFVAAFGKHPGWDDHIDDIGLETDVLIAAKRILYVQGVGANIDCGSWEKLLPDQRLEAFRHLFLWRMNDTILLGRMWSSQDGKGRRSYPMVVCAQFPKLPLDWLFHNILPALEKIEETCLHTVLPEEVKTVLADAQRDFRDMLQQVQPSQLQAALPDVLADLAERPEMGPDRQGLLRILYHIEREVTRYQSEAGKGRSLRATLLRVPVEPSVGPQTTLLWMNFLLGRLDKDVPVLALMPLDESWIDIIIGEPADAQLYCLRASQKMIPLTSDIPYNMGDEFVERTTRFIEQSRDLKTPPNDSPHA